MTKLQQELIDYLMAEIQVLKEKLGGKRILLNDDQRRRLAVKGKALGRKRLQEIDALFTPDTFLRWHRQLVAQKWDYSKRRKSPGRPGTGQEVVDFVIQMAGKTSPGDTIGFKEPWPIWSMKSRTARITTVSKRPSPDFHCVRLFG